ncbi:MAG: hypothetical protein HZA50_19665 [Planctomycetes bacterium]|nr:hypothetical protein [Planctomycetota bacterium]
MFLGIDVGTGKSAAVIVGPDRKVLADASRPNNANLSAPTGRSEQDVAKLLDATWRAVCDLPADLRRQVRAVGVTGQMHGVVVVDAGGQAVAPLINWQDQRCLEKPDFLPSLKNRTGHILRTGFGCATLAWLAANRAMPKQAAYAATIHDLAVSRLTGQAVPVTDPTDAASWGFFDLDRLDWNLKAVKKAGISEGLMPKVLPCGGRAGELSAPMAQTLSLPEGVPVAVAIGDNQASLVATLSDPQVELALTLGTGGQISAVLTGEGRPAPMESFEYRPYPGRRLAAVAAPLCGGAAWAWLAETVQRWLAELNVPCPSKDEIFARMDELGAKAPDSLVIGPQFLGERHDPTLRGAIGRIDLENFSLGGVARALARGILTNMKNMLPAELLAGRKRIVGSGNALRKSALLRAMAEDVFRMPLILSEGQEEAAAGAAIQAAALVESQKES